MQEESAGSGHATTQVSAVGRHLFAEVRLADGAEQVVSGR